MTTYPVLVLDRAELSHYLSVVEVDSLTEEDMQEIVQATYQELLEYCIFDFSASVARKILAEKRRISHGTI